MAEAGTGTSAGAVVFGRPQVVVVFVSALVMFSIAGWAAFYPRETYPAALIGVPAIALLSAIFALSVWNGSRAGWTVNFLAWGGILSDSLRSVINWVDPPLGGDFASSFNYQLLRLSGATVLLALLCWPAFIRWVWRREKQAGRSHASSASSASA